MILDIGGTITSPSLIYLSSLEEKLMNIEIPQNKYNNLTREERTALYDLKNDKTLL